MNRAENRVELTGFAGSDVELKETSGNKKLGKVSIAVNDNFRTATGEEVKNTQWFNLVFWGGKAEEANQAIKKGNRFSVEGKLSAQHYEAKDGSKRYFTEIVCSEFEVIRPAGEQNAENC